jgi:hypothetical protein
MPEEKNMVFTMVTERLRIFVTKWLHKLQHEETFFRQ